MTNDEMPYAGAFPLTGLTMRNGRKKAQEAQKGGNLKGPAFLAFCR
jgi:hypothetical protein